MTDRNLLERAHDAMSNSYTPYSRFPVGAAIECTDGSVFTGCSIENCSLCCTMCAERVAVGNAISAGHTDFLRIAIVSNGTDYTFPCGTCRQVLSEFSPNMEILCARGDGRYVSYNLKNMLSSPFTKEHLE